MEIKISVVEVKALKNAFYPILHHVCLAGSNKKHIDINVCDLSISMMPFKYYLIPFAIMISLFYASRIMQGMFRLGIVSTT